MQTETAETKFESYFLPFSAQIDEKTVISQSGLISQTIALNAEAKISFQEDVLLAIKKIYTKNVTINIHGIYSKHQSKRNANIIQHIKSCYKNSAYPQKEHSQEFFITISLQGYQVSKQNLTNLLFEATFLLELEKSVKRLHSIVEEFTENLASHSPRVLQTSEKNEVMISEQSSFLHKIIYGENSQISLTNMEIAEQLRPLIIKRSKNHITLSGVQEKNGENQDSKTYIACFTIKDFPKIDSHQLIKLFTLNHSFIISQTIHTVKQEAITGLFKYQSKITAAIRDNDIATKCGWNEILAEKHPITMQTNILIHSNDLEKLNIKMQEISQCLHKIGIVAVLEDINLEQAFYASMPSNSAFCNRFEYGTLNHAGQFLLSKSMIFEGSKNMKTIPFMPIASAHQKYYSFSPFMNGKSYHILAHGIQNELFTTAINAILLHTQINSVTCLDLNYSTIGLNKLKNGLYFKMPEVNIMNLFRVDKKGFEMFLTSLVLHFCGENKVAKNEEMQGQIQTFVSKIKPDFTFEQLKLLAGSTIISPTLDFAKANHFFSEKDIFMHKNKFISVNASGLDPKLCGIFAFYTLIFNLHKAQEFDIIKLDRSFDVFDPKVILQQSLSYLLREYKLKLVSVILCNNIPLTFEQKQIYRYSDIFLYFDIRFFAEGTCSNYFVKTFFQLNAEMTKNLMFVKSGSQKGVIQMLESSYTVNLQQSFGIKELSALNSRHKNFANIIKLIENNKTPSQGVIEEYNSLI